MKTKNKKKSDLLDTILIILTGLVVNYVVWYRCIEATKMCNLEFCPRTMDCCAFGCIGTDTTKVFVLILAISLSIIILIIYFITNYHPNK